MAIELHDRGFDLIEDNDPMESRYAYESKYRSCLFHQVGEPENNLREDHA